MVDERGNERDDENDDTNPADTSSNDTRDDLIAKKKLSQRYGIFLHTKTIPM